MIKLNIDIVLCIDISWSMSGILETVKDNVLKLYPDLMDRMEKWGKCVDKFRVKVIAFRDFETARENTFEILDFVDLPDNETKFHRFVKALEPQGNKQGAVNGLEALALAMDSEWTTSGDKRRHVIIIYSNAPTHSLEETSAYKPEGMPANIDELMCWWHGWLGQNKMDQSANRLILFAPDAASWAEIGENWEHTILVPSKACIGLDNDIYKEILDEGIVLSWRLE